MSLGGGGFLHSSWSTAAAVSLAGPRQTVLHRAISPQIHGIRLAKPGLVAQPWLPSRAPIKFRLRLTFLLTPERNSMKSTTSKVFKINATALTLALISVSASAAPSANAIPFGLEIGVATCDAARAKLGQAKEENIGGTEVLLTAVDPSALYEGASKAFVRCRGGKVIAVQIEASKGGMGSQGSRGVYANLSKKYKLVAGGPMPQLGDGYARFVAGNSVIEQFSPHLSFEFTLFYYEKSLYESIVASIKDKEKKSVEKKQSSL